MAREVAAQPAPHDTQHASRTTHGAIHPLVEEVLALAWLREWQLWAALALGIMAWVLAYTVPYQHELFFGGDRATARRGDDQPFLNLAEKGWNPDPEPASDAENSWLFAPAPPFRWAYDDARLSLPGLGGGTWRVTIVAAGQPSFVPTISQWSDGTYTSTVALAQQPRSYQHVFATDARGDLRLRFQTTPWTPPDDPRPLGFVAFSALISSHSAQSLPLPQALLLALCVILVYGLARRLVLLPRSALVASVGLCLMLALVLARWRVHLTSVTPALAAVLTACYPLGALIARGTQRAMGGQHGAWSMQLALRPSPSVIAALVVLAFALRLVGLLHPQIIFSDIRLNANNLLDVTHGTLFFTEGLPSEAGGGDSPYPPALYLLAAPLQLLFEASGEGRLLLLKVLVATLDSAIAWLIWFVLRRRSYSEPAALFAAALYVLPTATLRSFGVGEFANLAGQALAMPLLAALALLGGRLHEPRVFGLLLALFMLALLGHAGVTISIVLLLGYLSLSWILVRRRARLTLALLALGGLAALLVGLFFHSAFVHLLVPQSPAVVAAALPERSFVEKLGNESRRVFLLPRPTISPLLALLAVGGLVLMARRPRLSIDAPGLWPIMVAWLGSALLSIGTLAVRDQTVRWDLFLYPALCIAAGPLLGALWVRGRAGRLGATLALAALLAQGLWFWGWVVFSQYHG